MPSRVRPYSQADLVPEPPPVRSSHVGRIPTPPVEGQTGEFLYRVQIRSTGTGKT